MNTNKNSFITFYIRMFIKPGKTLDQLLTTDNKLSFGFYAMLVPALGYTLFYLMAWNAGGSPTTFKPWLNLPIEKYFYYDIYLTIPGYFISCASAAVVVFLLSRLLRGSAAFEDILMVIGFGIGIATWSSMLHDLTDALLATLGVIDMKEYEKLLNAPTFWRYLLLSLYLIYFSWFITLFTIGIRKANRFNYFKSVVLAIAGLAVFQTMLFIFIR
ncbi:MAG: hypothetical protein RBS55_10980 [Bacteroidales bacterium]|nr:hypothetical protein [Bacteroidales bacterium]